MLIVRYTKNGATYARSFKADECNEAQMFIALMSSQGRLVGVEKYGNQSK